MRTRLLTITLAAVLGVFGIVAVLAYVHQANDRAVNGLKAETVMFASKAIPAGTSLDAAQQGGLLAQEKMPLSSLSSPAVQSVTSANGHLVVSANVPKGSVVLQNMVARPGTLTAHGNGGVLPLPKGDIGVTMEMCLDTDVAGYVQPGSFIAVFDSVSTGGVLQFTCTGHQPPQKGKIITAVVVARIQVLSVTPLVSQGSVGSQVASDLSNSANTSPMSPVTADGEVLVTLAAPNQVTAEKLILMNSAGDPAYGLLTKSSVTNVDSPFISNSSPVQTQP